MKKKEEKKDSEKDAKSSSEKNQQEARRQYYTSYIQLQKQIMKQNEEKQPQQRKSARIAAKLKETQNNEVPDILRPIIQRHIEDTEREEQSFGQPLDLEFQSILASRLMELKNKQNIVSYIMELIEDENLIKQNDIEGQVLDQMDDSIAEFKPLLKTCIRQLIFSYSIRKDELIEIRKDNQEALLQHLYDKDQKGLSLNEQLKAYLPKRKIRKMMIKVPIKNKIIKELKNLELENYFKVYKFLTTCVFPVHKELKFQCKITNVINDHLSTLKRKNEFKELFDEFKKYYIESKVNSTYQKLSYINRYIKRFPLYDLILFVQKHPMYKRLIYRHIKQQKKDIVQRLLKPWKIKRKILSLFIFIDLFMSYYQVCKFEKCFKKTLAKAEENIKLSIKERKRK